MIPKHTTLLASPFLLMAMVLTGCSGSEDPEMPDGAIASDSGSSSQFTAGEIQWFQGSIEEAFAAARKLDKPIFLYWGADWCPPCNQIKATIFNRHEFITKSTLFVPLYLDGDTDNAQRIGEDFGVMGYPTMIVFSSQGEEVTRIPSGIDIQRYASILDLTLSNVQPVARLVDRVSGRGPALKPKAVVSVPPEDAEQVLAWVGKN